MGVNSKLYENDFYAWTREQAELLRAGDFAQADLENIVEEIESMGRSEKRRLVNRLTVLLTHLAKWRFQPGYRGRSWRVTIERQRIEVGRLLAGNPSLRPHLDEAMTQAWESGRLQAEQETGLDAATFPVECPWTLDQSLDKVFWPD